MTVRLSRTFEFDADPRPVWEFISDPRNRAEAISVVESYDVDPDDDRRVTWHIRLPVPLLTSTVDVETEDVERDPPRYVKFTGRSRALDVTGEHTVEADGSGSRLINEFVVDGRVPGVERFFKRNLDRELGNLEDALDRRLAAEH